MKSFTELRQEFMLRKFNTAITKEDFEKHFKRTNERIEFTFNGWDGKSYDGETRIARVLKTDIAGFENARFVKVGIGLHYIDEDSDVIEKETGIAHKRANWFIDVLKAN